MEDEPVVQFRMYAAYDRLGKILDIRRVII